MFPRHLLPPIKSRTPSFAFCLAGILSFLLTIAWDDPVGPTPVLPDQILFVSDRHGAGDIFRMNVDGTGVVNVGNNPSSDSGSFDDKTHGWSPVGRVALHSTWEGTKRTYLVNPDGTGLRSLFDMEGYIYPFWSPDGSKIAFSGELDGNPDLFIMNADGSGVVNLTKYPSAEDFRAVWVPRH